MHLNLSKLCTKYCWSLFGTRCSLICMHEADTYDYPADIAETCGIKCAKIVT